MALLLILALAAAWLVGRRAGPGTGRPTAATSPAPGARFFWETGDRPRALVDLDEIRPGGPPPDGIPAIDRPRFVTPAQANAWLEPREPVVAFSHRGEHRAYPLQILTWHEIVNDVVGGEPVAVTFCPLCNSAIAFPRRVRTTPQARALLRGAREAVLDFGTSGRLYRSNLVMYDRQTKSLWIQFTGQAVVGPFAGTQLEFLPTQLVSWRDARRAHPDLEVLSRETGYTRNYGTNPYVGYDDVDQLPFLYEGPTDGRLRAMDRVVTVRDGSGAVAYPLERVRARADRGAALVEDEVGGRPIVLFFQRGTASALDTARIAEARDVGATGVFSRRLGDRTLTFRTRGGEFVDAQTQSVWTILGEAVSGPLQGARLEPVVHDDTFWFVWAAFHPETRIWHG